MKDLLKLLIELQKRDSDILKKRIFIDNVPKRIHEVDEPLAEAGRELEKLKQHSEDMLKKKREKEAILDDINEKIAKLKSRVSDIKTNKEYQAHLKGIEALEEKISDVEEEILSVMVDIDVILNEQKEKEEKVNLEAKKITAFKNELDQEVEIYQKELNVLMEERDRLSASIEPDIYKTYMKLLDSGNGIAVTNAKDEICLGCNMNMPPQLFVEIRKNEEIIQCPQCYRILYYPEET